MQYIGLVYCFPSKQLDFFSETFSIFQPNFPTSVSLDVKARRSHKKNSEFEYLSDVKASTDNKDYHVNTLNCPFTSYSLHIIFLYLRIFGFFILFRHMRQ